MLARVRAAKPNGNKLSFIVSTHLTRPVWEQVESVASAVGSAAWTVEPLRCSSCDDSSEDDDDGILVGASA